MEITSSSLASTGQPPFQENQKIKVNKKPVLLGAGLAPTSEDKGGLLEKLKAKWNQPNVRRNMGNIAYVAAALLFAGAGAALALHFGIGQIDGFKIDLMYGAMAASFGALAVLKGVQFREEAKLLHKQQSAPPGTEIPIPEISQAEKVWKGVALAAGIAFMGLFIYQMVGVFHGAGGLHLSTESYVSAVGVLSYAIVLISRFIYKRRVEVSQQKEATAALQPTRLEKDRIRLLPNRLGKAALWVGGAIVFSAVVLLMARAQINSHMLSLTSILSLGAAGTAVAGIGFMQVFFFRNEQEIAAADAKTEALKLELDGVKLSQDPDEWKVRAQKIIGGAAILIAATFLAMQLLGIDQSLFSSIFHTSIDTSVVSIASVFSSTVGIAYTGIALLSNTMEHTQDRRIAALEKEKRKRTERQIS
jgi:hypothetical protein